MSHTLFWGIAMLLLIAAELMTGTFYLLMISLGALVAALAAQLGASVTAQCLLAACVSTVAVVRRETNSWRNVWIAAGYLFGLAYLMAMLTYQVALALGAG